MQWSVCLGDGGFIGLLWGPEIKHIRISYTKEKGIQKGWLKGRLRGHWFYLVMSKNKGEKFGFGLVLFSDFFHVSTFVVAPRILGTRLRLLHLFGKRYWRSCNEMDAQNRQQVTGSLS